MTSSPSATIKEPITEQPHLIIKKYTNYQTSKLITRLAKRTWGDKGSRRIVNGSGNTTKQNLAMVNNNKFLRTVNFQIFWTYSNTIGYPQMLRNRGYLLVALIFEKKVSHNGINGVADENNSSVSSVLPEDPGTRRILGTEVPVEYQFESTSYLSVTTHVDKRVHSAVTVVQKLKREWKRKLKRNPDP